jgi:glucosamine-6-phosphate deaminase
VTPGGVRVVVHASADDARREVAQLLSGLLAARGPRGATLALPTGRTPRGVYAELLRRHAGERLSFAHVTAFGLDELWPIAPDDPRGFRRALDEQLLGHVDIDPARRVHLDGAVPAAGVPAEVARFDRALAAAGGLDLALLGVGRNGHLAFNEPGSPRDAPTRLVTLEEGTRLDLARTQGRAEPVPRQALTMGLSAILAARRLVVMAFGESKAEVVARMLRGPVGPECPASFVRGHPDALVVLDGPAAAGV